MTNEEDHLLYEQPKLFFQCRPAIIHKFAKIHGFIDNLLGVDLIRCLGITNDLAMKRMMLQSSPE